MIIRRQAREHAHNGNEVDPSLGGGDVDLPLGGEVINPLLGGEIADLSLDVEEPSQIGPANLAQPRSEVPGTFNEANDRLFARSRLNRYGMDKGRVEAATAV